jgi:sugar-specific transcriptional regulator TrmB
MASLRDLGLSEYEARAYRALLQTGPTTARELSETSDVPMGRIYDVLANLERYDLIRSQAASHPTKYAAVEPETGLDRLLADRKRDLRERATQYEDTVEELLGELEGGSAADDERFWTAAVGPEDSLELLLERLAAADDQVTIVASKFSPHLDAVDVSERLTAVLLDALDRGVSVSLLVDPAMVAEVPSEVRTGHLSKLRACGEFEIRTDEQIEGTFNLIDQREVCVEVPNPLRREETFALIDLKDQSFAADARAVVEPRWDASEPLRLGQSGPTG